MPSFVAGRIINKGSVMCSRRWPHCTHVWTMNCSHLALTALYWMSERIIKLSRCLCVSTASHYWGWLFSNTAIISHFWEGNRILLLICDRSSYVVFLSLLVRIEERNLVWWDSLVGHCQQQLTGSVHEHNNSTMPLHNLLSFLYTSLV